MVKYSRMKILLILPSILLKKMMAQYAVLAFFVLIGAFWKQVAFFSAVEK